MTLPPRTSGAQPTETELYLNDLYTKLRSISPARTPFPSFNKPGKILPCMKSTVQISPGRND